MRSNKITTSSGGCFQSIQMRTTTNATHKFPSYKVKSMADFPSNNICLYTTTLKKMLQNKQDEKAEKLFNEMRDMALCSKQSYKLMLENYYSKKEYFKAEELSADLENTEDIENNNILLRIYFDNGKIEKAGNLFQKMRKKPGITCNYLTHHIMIKYYAALFQTEKLREILLEIQSNLKIYGSLTNLNMILAYYGDKDDNFAIEIFNSLPRKNQETYNVMINFFITRNQHFQVWKLFYEMKEKGIPYNDNFYRGVLPVVCKQNNWNEFERWWVELENETKFGPDTDFWNTRLLCIKNSFCIEYAIEEYENMKEAGIPPNDFTSQLLPNIIG